MLALHTRSRRDSLCLPAAVQDFSLTMLTPDQFLICIFAWFMVGR